MVALSWIKDNYTSLGMVAVIVLKAVVLASVLALILNLALLCCFALLWAWLLVLLLAVMYIAYVLQLDGMKWL